MPEGVIFRTKPELALAMVADAAAAGLPFRWVTGDSVYGDSPTFCQGVRALGKWYVLDSSADARVWTSRAGGDPARAQAGRGAGRRRRPKVATKPVRVDEVVAGLPAAAWRRVTVAEGSQGPLVYEYAEVRVWFSEEGLPSGPERLLVRRSLGQEPEVKYHRTNAPAEVPLATVAGDPVEAVEHRAGLPERQGRVRAGRVRDAGVGGVAPPHGPVGAGPVVPGPAAGPVRGEKAPG